MKKSALTFLSMVCPLSIATLVGCSNKRDFRLNPNPVGEKITYRFRSMGGSEVSDYCYYTDDYFRKPASQFNISLATTSMSMTQAAFPADKGGLKDYSQKYINFEAMSKAMGFSNLHWNADYVSIPQQNTIGLIMASKPLDDYTLIVLGIRGSDYGAEWAGNFYMGDQGDHAGFALAANNTLEELRTYISDNGITGKIKLWMGGFSRSAAVCNLTAGYLDESLILGTNLLGDDVSYTKDDIYAFCYEPPQGASIYSIYDIQGSKFDNIYCFVNFHDLVPRVAPTNFAFTRYGRQMYFPCSLFSPTDYQDYKEAMVYLYNMTEASRVFGPYEVDDFGTLTFDFSEKEEPIHVDKSKVNWQQGLFMNDFVESLSTVGIPSRTKFAESYQDGLMELFKIINDTTSEESRIFSKTIINVLFEMTNYNISSVIIDDFFNDPDMIAQDLIPFFLRAYQKYGISTTATELGAVLGNFIGALARVTLNNKEDIASIFDVLNITRTLNAHSFEIAHAWLRTMDPNYLVQPIDYQFLHSFHKIVVSEMMNVKVYDYNDNLIMQFKKGMPVSLSTTKYTYGLEDNKMTMYLPEERFYRIVLSSDTIVNANYSRSLFSFSTSSFVDKKMSLISIKPNEELTINIVPSNHVIH